MSVRVGNVVVAAPEAQSPLAVNLAEIADRPAAWPGLGRRDPGPLRLIVVPDGEAMGRFTRGRAPSWGAALAFPSSRTILLRADLGDLPRTLRHELAHLALHDAVHVRLPLWFDEGYAGVASGEWNRLDVARLSWAVLRGRLPEFRALDAGLRGRSTEAEDAYALAMSAVLEIQRRIPGGELEPFMSRLVNEEDFDQALRASTGLTTGQFEREWHRSLRRRYNVLIWLAAGGMWGVLAVALGFIAWNRRRMDRPRRAALDRGWPLPPPEEGEGFVTDPTVREGQRHDIEDGPASPGT